MIALVALAVSACFCHGSAEVIREWKGTKGVTIRASFVSVKEEYVYLKLESGQEVQALIKNLCSEDQAYIIEKAYEARDIEVTYAKESSGFYKESGVSSAALSRDMITFRIIEQQLDGSFKTTGDSRWLLKTIEFVEKEMVAVNKAMAGERLVSEGKFVLINYSVENDSPIPATPPPPLLVDQRDRKYLPLDNYRSAPFIPKGALQPEQDVIQPGFKKQFCSVYEVPLTCEAEALEVFPTQVPGFSVRRFEVVGKRVNLKLTAVKAEVAEDKPLPVVAEPANFNVFMKCIRLGQGGNTTGYYYDYNKKRSLAYGVELRTTSGSSEKLTVKAYFIGQISGGKDVVADKQQMDLEVMPGRIERLSLQSAEISQNYYYFYRGSSSTRTSAKLAGVIIQVWQGNEVLAGYSSLSQWNKHIKSTEIIDELGELRHSQFD
ncbi:MAG: hypothetical protein PHO37_04510 [Kiritimatiellae bacterium]|nr:hypothetical protein [Kiritimatiellia bacterium]